MKMLMIASDTVTIMYCHGGVCSCAAVPHIQCVIQARSIRRMAANAPASSCAACQTDMSISLDEWNSTSDKKDVHSPFPTTDFECTDSKILQMPDNPNYDVLKQVQSMRSQVKAVVAELQEIKSYSAGLFSRFLDAEGK